MAPQAALSLSSLPPKWMINQASVVLSGHKTTVLPSEHRWENRRFFWSAPLQRPIGAAPKLETLWKVWSHPRRMHHCHLERSCCLLLREHPVGAAKSRLAPYCRDWHLVLGSIYWAPTTYQMEMGWHEKPDALSRKGKEIHFQSPQHHIPNSSLVSNKLYCHLWSPSSPFYPSLTLDSGTWKLF